MANYLLIESHDPFESSDVQYFYDLAADLAKAGNTVTLFLIENGVLPARRSYLSEPLTVTAQAGVEVLADEFSLRERGIPLSWLAARVNPASIEVVIDQMADGRKVMFH